MSTSKTLLTVLLAFGLILCAHGATKVWDGSVSTIWATGGNWSGGTTPQNGDDLVFPDGVTQLLSSNNFSPNRTFNSITILGSNYVIRGNPIIITNGLRVGNTTGTNAIDADFDLGGNQSFVVSNQAVSLFLRGVTLDLNTHTLTVDVFGRMVISNSITGTGGLIKNSSGRLELDGIGANTYSGLTVISNGLVVASKPTAFGSSAAGTELRGGAIRIDGVTVANESLTNSSTNSQLQGRGGATSSWSSNIVLAADLDVAVVTAGTLNLSGSLSGSGGIIKTQPGTLVYSGSGVNSYSGMTIVNAGVLALNKSVANGALLNGDLIIGDDLGGTSADVVRELADNQINTTVSITINSSGLLDLNGFDDLLGPLIFNGGDITTSTGLLTMANNVTVNANSNSPASISGRVSLGAASRKFTVTDWIPFPEDFTIVASISGNAGIGITKEGTGEMSLSSSNSFLGGVTVNEGSLYVANDFGLGATNTGVIVTAGARLLLRAGSHVGNESLTLNGDGPFGSGAFGTFQGINSWAGDIFLKSASSIAAVPNNTDELRLTGVISGPGALTKEGLGKVTLAGALANTYTNTTTVSGGTLVLDKPNGVTAVLGDLVINGAVEWMSDNQVPDATDVVLGASGLLSIPLNDERVGSLSGSGKINLGTLGNLRFGTNGLNTIFSGSITGALGNIFKEGLGTTTFTGTNRHGGSIRVQSGTLLVNGEILKSPVIIGAAGTLGGSGSVADVTNTLGGILAPGDGGAGILTCNNVFLSGAGSEFKVELGTPFPGRGHDQLLVLKTNSLGNASLTVIPIFSPAGAPIIGDEFRIINNVTVNPVIGTFNGLSNGASFVVGGLTFRINYDGGNGNDTVLTLIDAPAREAGTLVTAGNGNGVIEPDECNLLYIVVSNRTATTLAGITGTLSSVTPGATTINAVSLFPDIPAFQKRTNTIPFQLSTAPFLFCGEDIHLELALQTTGHAPFTLPLSIPTCPAEPALSFSRDQPSPIPDNSNVGVSFPITVSNVMASIGRVTVSLHLTHARLSDLNIGLRSPDGTFVQLLERFGGANTNYGNSCTERLTFDDAAEFSLRLPYVGTFRPQVDFLGAFRGKAGSAVNGTWVLVIEDKLIGNGGGTLHCWTLNIVPQTAIGSGSCDTCMDTILTSATSPLSRHQKGRIDLDGTNSTCGLFKPCPGTNSTVREPYEAYTFRNGPSNACITATVIPKDDHLALVIYTNSFDPLFVCSNYLADAGADPSTGPPQPRTCSFDVGSNQLFIVSVSKLSFNDSAYRLTVTGGDCRPDLNITQTASDKVALDWTTSAAGYLLESTNSLPSSSPPPTVWRPLTNVPVVISSRFHVTNNLITTNQFYRLRKAL